MPGKCRGIGCSTAVGREGGLRGFAGVLLLVALPLLVGCQGQEEEVTPEEGEQVSRIAEPAASTLLRTLVGRLTAAMEEGGPAHAVEFCATEAIPLTRSVEEDLAAGMAVKRTSFRYRNPSNAPDEAEEMALRYFEETLAEEGQAPSSYVQQVSDTEYRYYQPLFVGDVCLQCHGDPAAMDPAVRETLQAEYPRDLATGYEAGDFRGLVRVTVPAERIEG